MAVRVPTAGRNCIDTGPMLKNALRLILLRFLPRRLVPILTAIEVVRLVRRIRGQGPEPVAPRTMVPSRARRPRA
jgi:hypothetical protein